MVYSPKGRDTVLCNRHGKRLKKDSTKEKISSMHYMKWTRVMSPVVFEEFKLVCNFCFVCFLFFMIVNR